MYKPSGIDWLGDVPCDWSVQRLRFVAELNPSRTETAGLDGSMQVSFLPMEAIGDDGGLNLDSVKPLRELESGYTYFRNGDVTVAKITPCFENGKGALMAGLSNGIGFGTTELIVARPITDRITGAYLQYIFRSTEFRRLGEAQMYGAGGQKRVPDDFVKNFKTAIPPLSEQTAIIAFLDSETRKIDELVTEQRRLIELLKEKRRAFISHAVSKGMRPDVPMKPSGIDWLGDVPEHWQGRKLRYLFRQQKRQGHSGKEVLSVYRDYGVVRKDSRTDNLNKTPDDLGVYQLVKTGDLVINKMKAWQGSLGISNMEGITSPDYLVFSPLHRECSEFLHLLLRSGAITSIYRRISNGIRPAQWRLEPDQFVNLVVFLPPVSEQEEIASFIRKAVTQFDALTAEAERAIELLQERRAALISAAVTGKIGVRGITEMEESQ